MFIKPLEKHINVLFYFYTFILVILAILPINNSESEINHTHIVHIRLDYLLHFAIFIPWVFLLFVKTGVNIRSNLKGSIIYILLGFIFAFAHEAIQYFCSGQKKLDRNLVILKFLSYEKVKKNI